jgi:hypothetical protein
VATTAAVRAKEARLPGSATITIRDQKPNPSDEVEVAPEVGKIHFVNKDKKEYRLRLWKPNTEPNEGIDILLPASGRATLVMKRGDEYFYSVLGLKGGDVYNGQGGGPIRN